MYPFSSRFVIHLLILVIATGVTMNSIRTREVSAEEFGTQSLIVRFLGGSSDTDLIVESSTNSPTKPVSYLNHQGLVGNSTSSAIPVDEEEQLALAQGGSAIIKPNIPTTEIADRPRDEVDYYVVEGGDTISTIAQKFGVSTDTILWENKLGEKDYIKPGDRLTILPMSGVSHQVRKGDTIASIAKKYGVETDEVVEYNKLASAEDISINQVLIVPGGEAPETVAPKVTTPSGSSASLASGGSPLPSIKVSASEKMVWPTTSRRINQYFKFGHTGLDIDGDTGSPIYAAESGRVSNVGWGKGYGLHIIIDHGGGKKTIYAHNSKVFVTAGQQLSKGQNIALMGCTGWCTGPHLHFEVIINGKKLNPLSYL